MLSTPVNLTRTQQSRVDAFLRWQGRVAVSCDAVRTYNERLIVDLVLDGPLSDGRIGDVLRGASWQGRGYDRQGRERVSVRLAPNFFLSILVPERA